MSSAETDAATKLKVNFLDMGGRKYGDSILVQCGTTSVLIDGGHAGDQNPSEGYRSIPQQLAKIFGHEPPFDISLLVVTHTHSDHIGCLPSLIGATADDAVIKPEWALLADPDLGWGRIEDGDQFTPDSPLQDPILAALREESWADVKDDALVREFLQDGVTLEDRYRTMIQRLRDRGTRVNTYEGRRPRRLLEAFQDVGLKIIGPSENQLLECARVIRDEQRVAQDGLQDLMAQFGDALGDDLVARYRVAVQGLRSDLIDAGEKGASPAVNNTSLVLSIEFQGQRLLFSGDTQYGAPQTTGLDDDIGRLRDAVEDNGPFVLSSLPHHGSYNGCDDAFFDQVGAEYWGLCAGVDDPGHPHSKVLEILRDRREDIEWGRTDRNGLVTFSFAGGEWQMTKQRGRKNSLEPNVEADRPTPPAAVAAPPTTPAAVGPTTGAGLPATTAPAGLQQPAAISAQDFVEVTARVPHVNTEVTITINVRPGEAAAKRPFDAGGPPPPPPQAGVSPAGPPLRIAGGRNIPKLLFATSSPALAGNIGGNTVVAQIVASLKAAGHAVIDLAPGTDPVTGAQRTAAEAKASGAAGVVLLGGYDVVPPLPMDTLPRDLRPLVSTTVMGRDHDRFRVWTDSLYADVDGDRVPEIPVSRIPDGRSAKLVYAALQAHGDAGASWRGVRNVKRPFADQIFAKCTTATQLLRSEKTTGSSPDFNIAGDQVYFMLHGAHEDATRFWGETLDSTGKTIDYPITFDLSHLPENPPSVVFTGCCWGALAGHPIASQATTAAPFTPRTPANSIALKYLELGTLAFVGCTGAHYSPAPPGTYFGGPMHESFWRYLRGGDPPARALWKAQREYMARIPHGPDDPDSTAIEHKILWQFTCLGLGW